MHACIHVPFETHSQLEEAFKRWELLNKVLCKNLRQLFKHWTYHQEISVDVTAILGQESTISFTLWVDRMALSHTQNW